MKQPIEKRLAGMTVLASTFLLSACGDPSDAREGPAGIPEAPDAAIQTVAREFGGGNTGILWQAMPASYQSDVNGIVQLAGGKFDAEIYNKSFELIARIGEVAKQQTTFLLNNQFLAQQPEEERADLEAAIPALADLLTTISNSEIASVEGLQAFDGQDFFENTLAKLSDDIAELSKLSEEEVPSMADLKDVTVSVVEQADGTATLELSMPGEEPQTEVFTQVEGRWVPQEIAAEWAMSMAEAQANLEAITPEEIAAQKPQIMGVLTMFEGVLNQLEAAETQEQFDQALQGAMMPIMGLMMMGQGGGMGAPQQQMPQSPQMPPAPPAPVPAQ
ncbi:MAG: hypothetical protein ACOC4K_00470 [Verrucomicrobiota bacterium]